MDIPVNSSSPPSLTVQGNTVTVYIGLPDLRPDYVAAARALGAPIMLSANALARSWTDEMRNRDEPHPGFRKPPVGRLDGVYCALDSMGFTAMRRWGGYPVTVEQYTALGASHPWVFWSSQDLCCEPEIATDEEEIVARIMETAARYEQLAEISINPPMKVLQGYGWWHYLICAEALQITDADTLVGLGSICRRQRSGPDGVLAIIDRLDRELPKGVRLHLFGVTSAVLEEVAAHPRIASMDSQAWGLALRHEHPTGRTNALAVKVMEKFYREQVAHICRGSKGFQPEASLPLRTPPIWKNRSDEYRTTAAQILLAIRNGELSADHYAISMASKFKFNDRAGAADTLDLS